MKSLLLFFCLFSALHIIAQQSSTTATSANVSQTLHPDKPFMYKIFGNADGTFGYDLYYGTRRIIHQSQIPAVSGNTGFQQKKHAVWVAELAIKKLEQGESLPTISLDELKKLKVI